MDGSKTSLTTEVRGVDWLFWIYNSITVILLLLFGETVHNRWMYLSSNFGLIFISFFIIRFKVNGAPNPLMIMLRNGYPYFYFFYLHWESGEINHLIFTHSFDTLVQHWDKAIFGVHLHDILYQFQPLWFSELIHFTYFFYYILILLPAFLFYKNNFESFKKFIFDVSLLYLIHYFIFYIFPVLGPVAEHYARFRHGVFFVPLMDLIYKIGDSPGGAIPSSHISIAILSWCWIFIRKRNIAVSLIPLVLGLIFSTVYLSYHYAIDALTGLIIGILFFLMMQRLRQRFPNLSFT